jgi:membrane protease YdiL (CAAX protease family)
MNLVQTISFFGIPGTAIVLGLYGLVPIAQSLGVPLIVSWPVALWLPIVVLLGIVVFRFWRSPTSETFKGRFRLKRLRKTEWLIIFGAFFLVQVCEVFLSQTGSYLAGFQFISTPPVIPELFDPMLDIEAGLSTFFAVPVLGNWWLVVFWLGWLIINIGGEELLWRGYALPMQERAFGRYAWLVNGLCWNLLIHAFMFWNFVTLMPISLVIPYLVQRYANTWIGIYIHGFGNLLVLVVLVPSIAGWF